MVHFAWASGGSIKERARLFYYAEIRRSLAYRGWSKYAPERMVSFSIRAPAGRLFRVHMRDNMHDPESLAEFFSSRYTWIPPEQPHFEPKVVYDIGANIGIASLYFATRFPRARFFGFEPVPANYRICAMNFQNLDGGKCFPWAIGAATGRASFELDAADLRGGQLKNDSQARWRDASPPSAVLPDRTCAAGVMQRFEVPVFSVADLVTRQGCPPPDFLKIDVEGAEVEVLQGFRDEVKYVKRMLIETHGVGLEAGCRDWCQAHGFAVRPLLQLAPGMGEIWCERQ